MPDLISVFQSSPATTFVLGADLLSQNEDGNYSTVRCYLKATVGPGGATSSQFNDYGEQWGQIDGLTTWHIHSGKPFMPSGLPNGAVRWLDVVDVNIGHNWDGTRGGVTFRQVLRYGGRDLQHTAWFDNFPRIAKTPAAPGIQSITNITANSARVNATAPDNMGATIDLYEFQAATNPEFTAGLISSGNAGYIHDVPGLTPGQRYYFRVRAHNRRGWGSWSGTLDAFVGLPAPTLTSWTQNAAGALVATWTAPNPATGLTGYRLQVARDAGFTVGVQNIDVANVLQHAVAGLAGGRRYWARVAARTAGGVNALSASRETMLVLSAGDLDGWTRVGQLPAGMAAFTAEGIRRGTVAGRQALVLENLSTAAVQLTNGQLGLQRVVTGLTIGKAYRFRASAQLTENAALARQYRLQVVGEGAGAATAVTTALTPLGDGIEFVADTTTATLQIMLAQGVTVPADTEAVERVAFSGIELAELVTDYPVRLRETVYESNLANHFDLACNSVGASWYVGKDGVTRFRLPGAALPVSAVFTDETDDTALHYIDVAAAYDTRGMVNRLDVTNYGVGEDRETEENDDLIVVQQQSIDAFGVRSGRLEVNLWDQAPYDESLADRLGNLLAEAAEPRLFVSSFRWNAQENLPAANALDVGQRITVRFNGTEQDSQIVALQHDITPRRWIVTVSLRRL
ncbi:minor tail protein [Microbacterium phage Sippinontea]|nr:minor tail protein [Microbacterium phage KayPaulus]QDF18041.1 minor tail protein [Microbacterium phage Belthelas]QOI67290.1 minor tail protein [Microbacterium phage Sippinontea]QRI45134.1 minor tail protein [Microbacterium phage Wolfpack]